MKKHISFILLLIFIQICKSNACFTKDDEGKNIYVAINTLQRVMQKGHTKSEEKEQLFPKNLLKELEEKYFTSESKINALVRAFSYLMGPTSSFYLVFLTSTFIVDRTDSFLGSIASNILGYTGGVIAAIPSAKLTSDFIYEKLDLLMHSKETVKSNFFTPKRVRDLFYYTSGLIVSSVPAYFIDFYLHPLLGTWSYAFTLPTLVGQAALWGSGTEKLCEPLYYKMVTPASKCISSKVNYYQKVERLENQIDAYKSHLLSLGDEEFNKIFEATNSGKILTERKGIFSISIPENAAQTKVGWVGAAIGFGGAYAALAATRMAVNGLLSLAGVEDSETRESFAQACGYIGFIASGSLRGVATKRCFEKVYPGFKNLCLRLKNVCARNSEDSRKKPDFRTEQTISMISGILTLLSTAGQAQIVLDAHIGNPIVNGTVISGNVVGTASISFWGYERLVSRLFGVKQESAKESLLKKLEIFKLKIRVFPEEYIDVMFDQLNLTAENHSSLAIRVG